ncbi:hypothetical protein H4I96_08705 [Botrytis cinerea]
MEPQDAAGKQASAFARYRDAVFHIAHRTDKYRKCALASSSHAIFLLRSSNDTIDAKSDQIRSDQIKSNQIKSNQINTDLFTPPSPSPLISFRRNLLLPAPESKCYSPNLGYPLPAPFILASPALQ